MLLTLQSFHHSLLLVVALVNCAGRLLPCSRLKYLDRSPELSPALGDYCVKHAKMIKVHNKVDEFVLLHSHEQDGLPLHRLDEVAELAEKPVLAVLLAHDPSHDVGHHVAESLVTLRLPHVASSLKNIYSVNILLGIFSNMYLQSFLGGKSIKAEVYN